jgi:hypothetical protein
MTVRTTRRPNSSGATHTGLQSATIRQEQSETADAGALWDDVGRVPAGSLEEVVWAELGALPPSRRTNSRD